VRRVDAEEATTGCGVRRVDAEEATTGCGVRRVDAELTAAAHASSPHKQLRTPYAAVLSLIAPDDGHIRPKHVEPSHLLQ
jgi:hypothetical protein